MKHNNKIMIFLVSVICSFLFACDENGSGQKEQNEEMANLVGYTPRLEYEDIMFYVVNNGSISLEEKPKFDVDGCALSEENQGEFQVYFEEQIMGEKINESTCEFNVIFEIGNDMLAVNLSKNNAYFIRSKEEDIKTYKFDITNEQRAFIDKLIEEYNTEGICGELGENERVS